MVTDELATTTTWGLLNNSGGVKVQVPDSQLEQARAILARPRDEEDDDLFEDEEPGEDDERIWRP
jgi:hypothetical protein